MSDNINPATFVPSRYPPMHGDTITLANTGTDSIEFGVDFTIGGMATDIELPMLLGMGCTIKFTYDAGAKVYRSGPVESI